MHQSNLSTSVQCTKEICPHQCSAPKKSVRISAVHRSNLSTSVQCTEEICPHQHYLCQRNKCLNRTNVTNVWKLKNQRNAPKKHVPAISLLCIMYIFTLLRLREHELIVPLFCFEKALLRYCSNDCSKGFDAKLQGIYPGKMVCSGQRTFTCAAQGRPQTSLNTYHTELAIKIF